ncbi:MAG: hypothetical protein AAFR88_05620 [Pseudomonadota bacterium]
MLIRIGLAAAPLALVMTAVPAPASTGLAATAVATQATATSAPAKVSAIEAFVSLEGDWEGSLAYRDYQSDKMETIPVAVNMEALPDGQTLVQRFDYTDPGFQVYITNLITVTDSLLTGATARAGRAFETYEKTITVEQARDAENWTAVLSSEGEDDSRPAMIRETMKRTGDTMTITKDVDFLDDDAAVWEFRNRITLKQS